VRRVRVDLVHSQKDKWNRREETTGKISGDKDKKCSSDGHNRLSLRFVGPYTVRKTKQPRLISLKKSFTIRPARADDAFSIGALAAQFANYLRELGDTSEFRLTAEAYLRDGFGANPAFAGLAAEENGQVIGYLLYFFGYDSDRAERTLDIADLYVEQTKRNQGVGKALITQAAKIAREIGAEQMVWAVFRPNDLATKFYEGVGAQRIDDIFLMRLNAHAI